MTIKTYAIPPEGCASYLTPGKRYEVRSVGGPGFYVYTDQGCERFCLWTGCAHLKGGNWQRIEEDDATEAGGAGAVAHYYVSGVVVTTTTPAYFQIMEEKDGKQVCIATVPFNKHINPKQGRDVARRDADMIVRSLNLATLSLTRGEPK